MNDKKTSIKREFCTVLEKIGRGKITGIVQEWWNDFETNNSIDKVLHLAKELEERNSTIDEYYWAYVYSQNDGIQYNLDFLDYLRLLYGHSFTKWLLAEDQSLPEQQLQEAGEMFKSVIIVRSSTTKFKLIIEKITPNCKRSIAS